MNTRKYYVIDQYNREHEIIMENSCSRYYEAYKDGVKEDFIEECLSFEAAFRVYCSEKGMRPVSGMSSGSSSTSQSVQGTVKHHTPADYLAALAKLQELLRNEAITKQEFETLKAKIIAYFGQ